MNLLEALLLGLLQGLTEFLPVSSSGHLALTEIILKRMGSSFDPPGVVFEAMLHMGTAMAVLWYERNTIRCWLGLGGGPSLPSPNENDKKIEGFAFGLPRAGLRMMVLLFIASIVTGLIAFPLRDVAESTFSRPILVGAFLLVTAGILMVTRWLRGGETGEAETSWLQAAVVGLAQGLAIFPGISRSGLTIAVGLGSGLNRAWAARFSFLLSVPVIIGVTLLEIIKERDTLAAQGGDIWLACLVGALAACLFGTIAMRIVIVTVSSSSFHRFAWYCLPVGIVAIVLGALA